MPDPMSELTLRLPPELHQAVKDAARAADLSMAQWIRRAIHTKLNTADREFIMGLRTRAIADPGA